LMIVTDDEGWLFYRGLDNSLRVLTELLLTIPVKGPGIGRFKPKYPGTKSRQ